MADLIQNERSGTTRLVGDNEAYAADVILKPDGAQRLLVDSETSISTDLGIIQQVDVDQVLSTVNYFDIYDELGSITLSGFALEFDNRNVFVRLELDGVQIFDINVRKLRDILDWNQSPLPSFYVSWNDSLKAFYFTPSFPLKSNVSIKIQARSSNGAHRYIGGLIQVQIG